MRKTLTIILALIVSGAIAQKIDEKNVPAAVKAKQKSLYPTSKISKWEKEDGKYEAEFDLNKVETSTLFDEKGNLLETETEIKISELPAAVSTYVARNYQGQKVKEAS